MLNFEGMYLTMVVILLFREAVGFSKDFFLTAHFSELMWNGVNGYKTIINKV